MRIGWDTKWNGHKDKYKGILKYIESKNEDDIIVFLDGFDTKINVNCNNGLLK